jgi:hypothetical protein
MIEKIILAIAITFALAGNIDVKPPQRAVAIEMDSYFAAPIEQQPPVLLML